MTEKLDMTQGTEWKKILYFSAPIMLGQFLQQLYNTVDGIVVSNFAGDTLEASEAALAAVGSSTSLIFLFLAVCIGLGNGGAVQIAQLYGARRMEDMRRAASTQIIALTVMGLVLSILGVVFAEPLTVGLMRVRDENIKYMAIQYFAIYSVGFVFKYLYNAIAGILRAVGDSRATLYFLLVSAVLNIVLDLVFVIKFNWDVMGVAVATVISQFVSTAFSLVYMVRKYPFFRYKRSEFVFDKKRFAISLKLGVPAIMQQTVVSMGNLMVQRLVNSFGQATMSAFMVGNRMENYALVPIFAINMGVATFTGQNVGANRYDRVKRGWRGAVLISIVACSFVSLLWYLGAPAMARLFNLSGESMQRAIEFQRFMSFCMVIFAAYMPTGGLLHGAGDALWMLATSTVSLTSRVGVAYALAYLFDYGYSSVWVCVPAGWLSALAMTYYRYFSNKWMTKALVHDEEQEEPALAREAPEV